MTSIVERMNPHQRQRCRALARAWRALKREVLEKELPIAAIEPRLGPPRSSLHPLIVAAGGTSEDER